MFIAAITGSQIDPHQRNSYTGVNMEQIRCQINCKCGKAAFHISKFHCSKARVSILFTLDANLKLICTWLNVMVRV